MLRGPSERVALPHAWGLEGSAMPYCTHCGKLRDTSGGACEQCRQDEAARASRTIGTAAVRSGMAGRAIERIASSLSEAGSEAAELLRIMANEGSD